MTRIRVARVLLLALVTEGLTIGAASAASSARPLQGEFASTCSSAGPCFEFDGHLSQLGRFTGQITSFVPEGQPGCVQPGAAGCTTATWTAANGDTVDVSSVFFITGFNSSTGLYTFRQAITIEGGSGRFEGATGGATATGETAGDFSTYHGKIAGTIGCC